LSPRPVNRKSSALPLYGYSQCIIGTIVFCGLAPAGAVAFSLVRNPEEFFGNIDNMDTNDG